MTRAAIIWNIHWPTTVLAVLLLPGLLGLGYWQLQRADQKRVALAEFAQRSVAPPIELRNLPMPAQQYTHIAVKGRYDNRHSFLLDNRIFQGRFGYEIITPFLTAGESRTLLVDRGWVAGDPARLQQPRIEPVEGEVTLTGHVYREAAHIRFVNTLDESASGKARWPKLVQSLQMADLQRGLGAPVLPFILRLDADVPGAYGIAWRVVNIGFGPERHIAYAVTWFTMAVTLVLIWLGLSSNLWQLIRGR
jgi:cytochrome oxidase assembly protein ShyY1